MDTSTYNVYVDVSSSINSWANLLVQGPESEWSGVLSKGSSNTSVGLGCCAMRLVDIGWVTTGRSLVVLLGKLSSQQSFEFIA